MLRTNNSFLSFIQQLYETKKHHKEIHLKRFPKGSRLLQQGEKASKIFIVAEGITKCYFSEENGKNYILEFLGAGEIAGELEVIKNINCLCNIEAVTEVQAYVLTVPIVKSLLANNPLFNHMLLTELAERIINTSSRSSFQQLYSVEHALKKLLMLQSEHQLSISKEDMAAYLGVTLRSLNRLLAVK
ncbi:CRP-like cAMP-binding protein [Pedobacter sp. CAN_A7]|uniref:Crp/Fnr family transcriptional regulator n=1 Tax=Pedobacter sp. CAN_A7 TaxID=2787722 RepID=UPI0018CA13E1